MPGPWQVSAAGGHWLEVSRYPQIRSELGLIASVGVAPNKFVAKIASDLNEPDGVVEVQPNELQTFLDLLPIGHVWGIGRVTEQALETLGIRTTGLLRQFVIDTAFAGG